MSEMQAPRAFRHWLRHFIREPLFGLHYRREWGEWPLIWKWEDGDV